jgi:hypothetical protein
MLYYDWILNIDDKKLHENTAEASEYIIREHSATGCYDTVLLSVVARYFSSIPWMMTVRISELGIDDLPVWCVNGLLNQVIQVYMT